MSESWPLPAFHFNVVIHGNNDECAFQEVSGIESQIETEEYREGGNNVVYYLPKTMKHSNLIIKRGIANSRSALVQWCESIQKSQLSKPIETKIISVHLLNEKRSPCRTWVFYNAYPVKWKVDSFNSTKNDVAIEEIEFCYSRVNRSG